MNDTPSPIRAGWRGNLSGSVEHTEATSVSVTRVEIALSREDAWALCNVLLDKSLDAVAPACLEGGQIIALSTLGAALGRLVDHPSANNGGREVLK